MRKNVLIASILSVALAATIAFAATGRQPKDGGGVTIQNAAAIAPTPAAARCDTTVKTKGALKSYSTAGYSQINWTATDANGTAVIVKRKLNSNSAHMPGSSGNITNDKPLNGAWSVQKIVFDKYSTVSATVVTCVDRQ